jgi:acyl-CoA synthetase (AMP-forming)/AMP-acid ligase II
VGYREGNAVMKASWESRENVDRSTVVSLLRTRAEQQPDAIVYSFVSDGGVQRISYAELDRRARAIGRVLADRRMGSVPVLLLYPPGLDYIAAFFGCLYAGVIAVPACVPDQGRLQHSSRRLAVIAQDAMPLAALTTEAVGTRLPTVLRTIPGLPRLRVLATDDLPEDRAWQPAAAAPDSIALLHYTSGATSAGKGVALTHRNLLSSCEIIFRAFGHSRESRGVAWLPPCQGMGLIGGIIQPLYGGFPMTLMSPADVLRRPLRWLEEIARIKATTSGGPDFAYDLCVRETTEEERSRFDLSSWRVAFNYSEPVRVQTMELFARAFRPSGFRPDAFYPCYGLAEGTFLVTGRLSWPQGGTKSFDTVALRHGRAIPAVTGAPSQPLVSCGSRAGDHRVLIVDPATGAERAAGEVGEIWLSGGSAVRSYWRRPEETRTILGARLTGTGEGPFVRSGDLGFLLDDQLYVMGRMKDLIVTGGCIHHPEDIERSAERSSPVLRRGRGAAFLVADGSQEFIVIAYEISRQAGAVNVGDVAGAIRAAVTAEHGLRVHTVVLVAPGGIPKTAHGKIQRRLCAALFEQRKLAELGRSALSQIPEGGRLHLDRPGLLAVPAEVRRDLLREYLCRLVASVCETAVADTSLLALGVDSCAINRIQHSIAADLGVHLTAPELAHTAGIRDLAILLDELLAIVAASPQPDIPALAEERSLWFLREIRPGTAEHSFAIALRLRGELDIRALDRAVDSLVAQQARVNPAYTTADVAPIQCTAGTVARAWLRDGDVGNASDDELAAHLDGAAREPFDLARGPLLRIHLYRRASRETVLLVVAHRVIADFWSLTTFARELEMLCAEQTRGTAAALPEPTDFVRHYSWISGSRVPSRAMSGTEAAVSPHYQI